MPGGHPPWVILQRAPLGIFQRAPTLKRLNGEMIHLPSRVRDRPDRDRLAQRFERFKEAA
jgi:hypothetical protein